MTFLKLDLSAPWPNLLTLSASLCFDLIAPWPNLCTLSTNMLTELQFVFRPWCPMAKMRVDINVFDINYSDRPKPV